MDDKYVSNGETGEGIGLLLRIFDIYPLELAEYAISDNTQHNKKSWWVPYTSNNCVIILSRIKCKYWPRSSNCDFHGPMCITKGKHTKE